MLNGQQKTNIVALDSSEAMFDFIEKQAQRASGIRCVQCSFFNGGAFLRQLMGTVRKHAVRQFSVKILVWDHQSANLPADADQTRLALKQEIERIDRFLRAHDVYDAALQYQDFTALSCEYLLLGSQILNVPARHPHHLGQIGGMVRSVMADAVTAKHGSILARKSPYYHPGRIILIDDWVYFSAYLYGGLAGTVIAARNGTLLYSRLKEHFQSTWDLASASIMDPLGGNADSENVRWAQQEQVEATDRKIFLSYRRGDTQWSTGRLYDHLIGAFSSGRVFMDRGMLAGASFPTELQHHISMCAAMLVIVGPNWAAAVDADGNQKLRNPSDWVRREVKQALDENKLIIPVLLDDAKMPNASELPGEISQLADRQGLRLRCDAFEVDAGAIVRALARV